MTIFGTLRVKVNATILIIQIWNITVQETDYTKRVHGLMHVSRLKLSNHNCLMSSILQNKQNTDFVAELHGTSQSEMY
jgi:hypothetical protein